MAKTLLRYETDLVASTIIKTFQTYFHMFTWAMYAQKYIKFVSWTFAQKAWKYFIVQSTKDNSGNIWSSMSERILISVCL